jgi:hypothetical protein
MDRIHKRIATSLLAATVVAVGTVGVSAAPADALPMCMATYSEPMDIGASVYAEGFALCADANDPQNLAPVTVVLQRLGVSGWVTVATGLGEAQYFCVGTNPRIYRVGSRPAVTVTLSCS